MKNINTAFLAVFLSAVFGGGINTFIKIGITDIPPLRFSFLRFLLAAIILFPLFLHGKHRIKNIFNLLPFSLLGTANIIFFVIGIKYTTAISSQLIYLSVPITVSILSHLIYKERLNRYKIAGIVIGLIGSLLLITGRTDSNLLENTGFWGNSLIFVATLFYSLYVIFSKKIQRKHPPLEITASFCLTTLAVTAIFSVFELSTPSDWSKMTGSSAVISLIYVGFFGTAIYYLLQQYAVKHGTPVLSSVTLYIQPLFTLIWSYFLLGEKLTGDLTIAGGLIFIGAYLVSR